MKYKLILFDLDGTLLASAPSLIASAKGALERHFLVRFSYNNLEKFAGMGGRKLLSAITNWDMEDLRIEKTLLSLIEIYQKNYILESPLFPGVSQFLERLEKESIAWGIYTNKRYDLSKMIVDNSPHLQKSQILICPPEVELKPSPQGMLQAFEHFQVAHEEVLMVGDTVKDAEVAKLSKTDFAFHTQGYTEDAQAILEDYKPLISFAQFGDLNTILNNQ